LKDFYLSDSFLNKGWPLKQVEKLIYIGEGGTFAVLGRLRGSVGGIIIEKKSGNMFQYQNG